MPRFPLPPMDDDLLEKLFLQCHSNAMDVFLANEDDLDTHAMYINMAEAVHRLRWYQIKAENAEEE